MDRPEGDDDSTARDALVNREGDSALVDAKEAARLCSISESMLYKLNAAGRMPPPIRIGSLLRWRRRDILEWIDAGCPTNILEKNKQNAHRKRVRNRSKHGA